MNRLTVLILGGYGIFGGRLAQLLADEPRLTLMIAGRDGRRAAAFCQALPATASLSPLVMDRKDARNTLEAQRPDVVVDASGPFQTYGRSPYGVVEACLALGIHYLDLADGADFVAGISAYDAQARAAGISILAGVSSFPVLTAAVVRHLSLGMAHVRRIHGGIAPSPYAGVGLNVIRAVAGYAGKPVKLRRDGRPAVGIGLVESMRATVAAPGRLPLVNTRFALVEVPDLLVLPLLWPEVRDVWMGAGPVPEVFQRTLGGLAWLVSRGIIPSLTPASRLFHAVTNGLRWGEDRGGMFVDVTGQAPGGTSITRSWHMVAEGKDGPLIPSMAAAGVVRRMLDGRFPAAGARAATTELELADYAVMFAARHIHHGTWHPPDQHAPLFARVLGTTWGTLPAALRAAHSRPGMLVGKATVERGSGWAAGLIARAFGFPPSGREVPLVVIVERTEKGETWTRRFGDHTFRSRMQLGSGRWERLLVERFGPFSFGLALVWDKVRLHLVVRCWSVFGMPLSRSLAPESIAHEAEVDGRFTLDVEIRHRLLGRVVRYTGWLRLPRSRGQFVGLLATARSGLPPSPLRRSSVTGIPGLSVVVPGCTSPRCS